MRLWQDGNGTLLTDEQLLAYLAAFGSLKSAVATGDIVLISAGRPAAHAVGASGHVRLADFLEDEDEG